MELAEAGADDPFARVARLAAFVHEAPVALVCLRREGALEVAASLGLGREPPDADDPLVAAAACGEDALGVPDLLADRRFRASALLAAPLGLRACLAVPVLSPEGESRGAVAVLDRAPRPDFRADGAAMLDDLAGLADALLESRLGAETDGVTGCLSRRRFLDRLAREARRAAAEDRPVTLALLDVDQHEEIQGRFGRATGEEVLRAVAERMRRVLRAEDVLGWIEGESFALLLPRTGLVRAEKVARRLRSRVAAEPVRTALGPMPVTVSVGLSGPQELGGRHEGMVSAAAIEVCRARSEGGNRVRLAPQPDAAEALMRAVGT